MKLAPLVVPDLAAGSRPVRVTAWLVEPGESVCEGDRLVELLVPGMTFDVASGQQVVPIKSDTQEIAGFGLPEVTGFPEVPDSARQWQAERDSGRDDRYRAVWVANHPPLNYVAAAPLIWLSNALDRPDGGLMFLRLVNIAFALTEVAAVLAGRAGERPTFSEPDA